MQDHNDHAGPQRCGPPQLPPPLPPAAARLPLSPVAGPSLPSVASQPIQLALPSAPPTHLSLSLLQWPWASRGWPGAPTSGRGWRTGHTGRYHQPGLGMCSHSALRWRWRRRRAARRAAEGMRTSRRSLLPPSLTHSVRDLPCRPQAALQHAPGEGQPVCQHGPGAGRRRGRGAPAGHRGDGGGRRHRGRGPGRAGVRDDGAQKGRLAGAPAPRLRHVSAPRRLLQGMNAPHGAS